MEMCTICRENMDLSSSKIYTLPECGHKYHLECIMTWWRSPQDYLEARTFGLCPLCRQGPKKVISWRQRRGRVSYFKRMGRKKCVHPLLRKALNRYKKSEKHRNDARKELWDWKRKYKDIFSKERKLSTKYWHKKMALDKVADELASFDPMGCYIKNWY